VCFLEVIGVPSRVRFTRKVVDLTRMLTSNGFVLCFIMKR
jgi:hypothetical protein